MMKRVLNLIIILFFVISACAQNTITKSTEKVVIDGEKYYLHTVESGQTLYSICKAYGVTEETVMEANPELTSNLKLDQVINIPVERDISEDGSKIIYVIKKGDTLYSLCKKYGLTEEEFYEMNPQVNPRKGLKTGKEIYFPNNTEEPDVLDTADKDTINYYYHEVAQGETFYALMRKYSISKEELLAANPGLDENALKIGQEIRIPKDGSAILSDENLLIDSLAALNFNNDSILVDSMNICDTANWYSYGNEFKVCLLLPFEVGPNLRNLYNQEVGNREQRLYLLTEKIVSFYSGILVALEELKEEDVKIDLAVYDIGKDFAKLSELIDDHKLDSVDLIVGPAFKSQVVYLNDNLKDTCVTIVLPFVNDVEILEKYPNNIALKTTNDKIYEHIGKYAAQHPQNKYFVIQGTNDVQQQAANEIYNIIKYGSDSSLNVTTIKFNGTSLVGLKSVVSKETENVFILPFSNESSTMKIFTDLFPLKDIEVTLIGSNSLMEFESIDPNYYRKIKFTYYTCQDIHYSDTLTEIFISKYHDIFLCEPDEYSYSAYDAVKYLIPKLMRHGKGFAECILCDDKITGITGDIDFSHKSDYAKKSYSRSSLYMFSLQEDFEFVKVYPESEIIDD
ncbi:MAG: hypothetical protein C0596_18940 [Marinilabiliales bacterium]|nr:MAG: hypothetical protein C0596_18940 [Marinilabiliales bacterium]